jgi:hypothetical protein
MLCRACVVTQATKREGIAKAAQAFKANLQADPGAQYDQVKRPLGGSVQHQVKVKSVVREHQVLASNT